MPSFLDTNILIYSIDTTEPEKRKIAGEMVEEHLVVGDGMISVQVLREFYSVSRRMSRPLSEQEAGEMVEYFSAFRTVSESTELVLGAVRRSQENILSLWDTLILEAALSAGADRLLTEDLQHGQVMDGLRIENPFVEVEP